MNSPDPNAAEPSPQPRRLAMAGARVLPLLFFFILPLLLFWQVLWGTSTLIPFDNLYQGLPWSAFSEQLGVGAPHNELVSDLVLQNVQWKSFATAQYRQGELPMWQPAQFAGTPFLAAGQHSMLYPLSLLYLLLPVHIAFGWFALLSLALAGVTMYLFGRAIGMGRGAALLSGLVYQGSGFLAISVVFPMIVAGAAWLPLLLAAIHRLGTKGWQERSTHATAYLPWMAVGSIAIGMAALAGHVEILYYTLLVGGLYALWHLARVVAEGRRRRSYGPAQRYAGWGIVMLVVGLLLGAAQLVPLYELVSQNFRDGSAKLEDVIGYAWPGRQASSFVIPDLLGNPTRHSFYNLESRQWEPIVTQQPINEAGDTISLDQVAWFKGTGDWKNYVEGAGYLGILPLLLTAIAMGAVLRGRNRSPYFLPVTFFAMLALLSVLFVFGSPLYALLFYGLPGWNQLHTPFRWIFPLTISVSVLAGIGWQIARSRTSLYAARLGWIVLLSGLLGLAVLLIMWATPAPFIAQAAKLLDRSQLARWAFGGSAALFVSYQWVNFVRLGIALGGAGMTLILAQRGSAATKRGLQLPTAVALSVLVLDLTAASRGFAPAVPVSLADFTPPSIEWLAAQHDPGAWRYTALEQHVKVLNANSGMRYGLEDIRGYDSIIPRHYVEFMEAVSPQRQLDFNRVAPLYADEPPDQELLDLLNVRFIATDQAISWPGWTLAYDNELRIYENEDVLPRAFMVGRGEYFGSLSEPLPSETLRALDPRAGLIWQADPRVRERVGQPSSDLPFTPARIVSYDPGEVVVQVAPDEPGWLLLADVDFPGWRAFSRREATTSSDAGGEAERESAEVELAVVRANGAFRAVWLDAGEQIVRWRYSPNSIKSGFFASFLGVAALGLASAYWVWGRIYQEQENEDTARRVAKNSIAPMALQLFNKGVDTVFAAFMARLLGPEALGQYAFAVNLIWYVIIFSNFGLGTLLTRDAARDRAAAARLLTTTFVLRIALYVIVFPLLLILLWIWPTFGTMESTTALAAILLAIGLIPSNAADAVTAVFRAYERFEVPALVATIATFVKVAAGAGVLLAGYGIVGLAATSILTNIVTLVILSVLMVRMLFRPTARWEPGATRGLLRDAFPLMINEFLATAFFRIDQVMLKPLRGERGNLETGYYNVAYKFIDGLLILPSTFTLAIFPVMSRYAQGATDALHRATVLSLRWLVMIALPLALLTTRYASGIVLAFGGPEFLPDSAIALQVLIWFLPFSFVNSLLQYVLIAADRQHSLTRAYIVALLFNVVANYFAIREFGILGAAAVTIFSELTLLVPFYVLMRQSVGSLPWTSMVGKPLAAMAVAALPLWALPLPFWIAIPASVLLYGAILLLLRAVGPEDRAILARVCSRK